MELHEIQGKLFPIPPFDFSKSLSFTSMFTPTEGEQTISDLSFTKAIYLEDQTLAFKLEDYGTIEKPILSYTLYSEDKISDKIKNELLDRIKFYLSLEDDLTQFYEIGREDPDFSTVLEDLYGLHQVKFLTPFEAAAWAVLSQRISMKAAHTLKNRITENVGDHIQIEGFDYWTFPDAHQINDLGLEKLQSLIKNRRKSEYLIAVADAFQNVDESFLRNTPIKEVKEWLTDIKGIGEWSAHLELIRGLGRMEGIPEHDMKLSSCFKKVYGSEATEEYLQKIADSYGEFKGYWTYYLRTGC
ncbi:MAG TPA: DNA-3-methyladenine glycosylase [Methanobacterium sp.]|nr:DNA-3-methyladenine glycosylase [Methanobacterium sp.]